MRLSLFVAILRQIIPPTNDDTKQIKSYNYLKSNIWQPVHLTSNSSLIDRTKEKERVVWEYDLKSFIPLKKKEVIENLKYSPKEDKIQVSLVDLIDQCSGHNMYTHIH